MCDGKGPSVTIIRTQYDRLIGGYTTALWQAYGGFMYDVNAFLFSMTEGEKYKVICPEYAIYCDINSGSTFGVSLKICDMSNVNNGSKTEPCGHYECEGSLGGPFNNGNICCLKVKEYEMWLVE